MKTMNFLIIIGILLVWSLTEGYIAYKELKSQIITQKLDITESRKREDLLLQQVKLLQYQVDILSTKDLK